jgi:hypothetical protein
LFASEQKLAQGKFPVKGPKEMFLRINLVFAKKIDKPISPVMKIQE